MFCLYFKEIQSSERWKTFPNYQHFKTLLRAYKRAHLEKNKSAAQTAVRKIWKKMKPDFPAVDELEEEVKRQANEWET